MPKKRKLHSPREGATEYENFEDLMKKLVKVKNEEVKELERKEREKENVRNVTNSADALK